MDSLIDANTMKNFAASVLDAKQKVTLVCGHHKHAYRDGKPPIFNCKDCWMVEFVGLLCNLPQDRWDETVEMLEYSVHHMVESAKRGELQQMEFLKHPEVTYN
jgi:hypothetical protein